YFGKKLPKSDLSYVIMEIPRASYLADTDSIENFKLEQLPVGYPAFGNSDLRSPAHQEIYADGSRLSDFRYVDHSFSKIKQPLNGLPYANTEWLDYLIIELSDRYTGES
ncbi:alpha-galactosidase, partial [Enterococcus faecalis]|nr:alpha-galactosidase [Enterococcus faecalis]